jgi:hypothetical protein
MLVRHHDKAQPAVEVVKEEDEEQVEGEAEGRADEGEKILALIEQMEREDEEAILVDNDIDDSDEVGDPVLADWIQRV